MEETPFPEENLEYQLNYNLEPYFFILHSDLNVYLIRVQNNIIDLFYRHFAHVLLHPATPEHFVKDFRLLTFLLIAAGV